MFDSLTTQLGSLLDALALAVEKNASAPISPCLLVHPPSSRESHKAMLRTRQADLGPILQIVKDLEAQITSIRTSLFRQQHEYAYAQVAASALPHEILCKIFSFAAGRTSITKRLSGINNISLVCRTWYTVATNRRSLWTDICLPSVRLRDIDGLLKRSGNEPLLLQCFPKKPPFVGQYAAGELRRRLRSLKADCSDLDPDDLARLAQDEDGQPSGFVALKNLELSASTSHPYDIFTQFRFPILRRLVLSNVILRRGIRAKSLTFLVIKDIEELPVSNHLSRLLAACPRLRSFTISSVDGILDHLPSIRPTTLENLESLAISSISKEVLIGVLLCIRAPHLQTFVVEGLNTELGNNSHDEALVYHHYGLNERGVGAAHAPIHQLINAISQMIMQWDRLSRFSVEGGVITLYALLIALKPTALPGSKQFSPPFAPGMEELCIMLPDGLDDSDRLRRSLQKMIHTLLFRRAAMGCRLKKLFITECLLEGGPLSQLPDGAVERLEKMPCGCDHSDSIMSSNDNDNDDTEDSE